MNYDVVIIGRGPAGISASLYLARAGYRVAVLGAARGALDKAEKIENYYGFPEPVSGAELADRGVAQAERLGVVLKAEEAVSVSMEDGFVVRTAVGDGGTEYRARAVLIATGKSRAGLKVPGFEALRGRGISFCATCDGFFYRGKRLAVIGSGDYAASELGELLHFTKDITLFTDGASTVSRRIPAEIPVVREKIAGFSGTDRLTGISTVPDLSRSGEAAEYPVDGVFVAIGTAGAADFAAKIGVEVNGTDIVVDDDFMTNVPGIFAAGDCIGGYLQIAKAVSDGAHAAKGMTSFLKQRA